MVSARRITISSLIARNRIGSGPIRGPSSPPNPLPQGGGGGLRELNGREAQPFPQGPDVIGQARRHRRSPRPPPAVGSLLPQRPNRPTEVVPIQREVGHRLMRPPILTEPVRPPRLP